VGGWPFRKIRYKSFEDLKRLHADNNIEGGFVSSTYSIFYNDPYEGDMDLRKEITDDNYNLVLTVNPLLPGAVPSVKRGIDELNAKGVKVFPWFHDFDLNGREMKTLTDELRETNLPLFIVLRGDDERLQYMFSAKEVQIDALKKFLEGNKDLEIYLCNIRMNEVEQLKDQITSISRLYFDFSGLKSGLFQNEQLIEMGVAGKARYGSMWPLNCMKSTVLSYNLK